MHLRDLTQVLFAHWKVVVFLTVLVVFATYYTSRKAVPRYQSSAIVQVSSKRQALTPMEALRVDEMSMQTDPVLSEAMVLSTQALALRVVDALGLQLAVDDWQLGRTTFLYDAQVDSLARPDSFVLELNRTGYQLRSVAGGTLVVAGGYDVPAVGSGFSFRVREYRGDPRSVRVSIMPRLAAGNMVRGGMSFAVPPTTSLVNVTFTGTDPSLVPEILNEALIALQSYGVDRVRDVANQRLRYINERVDDARVRYLAALSGVQSYKESEHTTDFSAEEVAIINSIQGFDHDKERLQVDLSTLQGIMGQEAQVTLETLNRLASVTGIATNAAMTFQIQNLLKLYDDRRTLLAGSLGLRESNPQVQAMDQRITQAAAALREAAHATVRGIQANIASLNQNIANLRQRLGTYPGKETRFAQLRLEIELQNDTYKYLLAQLEAARIAAATIAPYIQIVETATVATRIGVGTRQKVMIGLLVGLFLGIVTAFFLEYLDQTIKTAADVERALEIPVLGLIQLDTRSAGGLPKDGRRRGSIHLVSLSSPDDPTSEAYRALRTNVTFVNAEQRALQLICVTSPGPGEGKSTTAANLAVTLAQQGTTALLVDADLRRPIVHRAFNLVQEPGLTDVLVGNAQLREAIRPNVIPKLDILPAGTLPPNPSELLGSAAMRRLLEQLRTQYDTVLFDLPPTLAVTDAAVLGASTDAVILVLRSGETEEVAAQRSLGQLRHVQARVAGSVLNGVQKTGGYYDDYYYRKDRRRGRGPLSALRERIAHLF
ncbi:MAG: polysaccharide biosynthesis tyrosine autokinase [Gemmatimonadota bacterium]